MGHPAPSGSGWRLLTRRLFVIHLQYHAEMEPQLTHSLLWIGITKSRRKSGKGANCSPAHCDVVCSTARVAAEWQGPRAHPRLLTSQESRPTPAAENVAAGHSNQGAAATTRKPQVTPQRTCEWLGPRVSKKTAQATHGRHKGPPLHTDDLPRPTASAPAAAAMCAVSPASLIANDP